MFYFAGDILLSFQLNYEGSIITPADTSIEIFLENDTLINQGVPVLVGTYYNYVVTINNSDITPDYYNNYRFLVTAVHNGETIYVNGYFIVHVTDYNNFDNTAVFLSNSDSEIFMPCADQTREQCLASPPVTPQILSIDMYKMSSAACDCYTKK
jgi:hypothetical protein